MTGEIKIKDIDGIRAAKQYRKAVGSARSAVYIIFALSLLTFAATSVITANPKKSVNMSATTAGNVRAKCTPESLFIV